MADPFHRLKEAMADRYTLERELGAGGMATVYLAHDPRHNRKVAIKVMNPELAAIIGAARFLKEIETTANLQHPNILPLFDSGQVDATVFYVMPFVQGESLRNRLTREVQLPVADAVRIAVEVAGDPHRVSDGELDLPSEPVAERFALDERHDVEHRGVDLAGVEQGKDVGVLEVGGGLDFLEEARGADDGRELLVHNLDGDFAIVPGVVGEVDGGHAAGTELALERVAVGQGFLQAMERIGHEGKICVTRRTGEGGDRGVCAPSRPSSVPKSGQRHGWAARPLPRRVRQSVESS